MNLYDNDDMIRQIKADAPPEHKEKAETDTAIYTMIAETLDIPISRLESLPEELRETAVIAYMNSSDMPKSELKELLADSLELTPQADDIKIETPARSDKSESKKGTLFSRAAQKEFSERAAERAESLSKEKERQKNNENQIEL